MERTKTYAKLGSTIYERSPSNQYAMVPLPDLTFPQFLYQIVEKHGDGWVKSICKGLAAAALKDIAEKAVLFTQIMPEVELRRCVMYLDGILDLPTSLEECSTAFTRFQDLPPGTRPFLPQATVDVAWNPSFWTDKSHLSAWSRLINFQLAPGSDQEKVLLAMLGRAILYPLLSSLDRVDGYQSWLVIDGPARVGKSMIITLLRTAAFNENRVCILDGSGRSGSQVIFYLKP